MDNQKNKKDVGHGLYNMLKVETGSYTHSIILNHVQAGDQTSQVMQA